MTELERKIERFERSMKMFEEGNSFGTTETQMLDLAEKEMRNIGRLIWTTLASK
jgi:exonuclease VII small subunit